jgi:hypothetical protein
MIVQDKCVNEVRRRGLVVRGVHDHLHRAATSELYSVLFFVPGASCTVIGREDVI